jgi:hypothetical protein
LHPSYVISCISALALILRTRCTLLSDCELNKHRVSCLCTLVFTSAK